jgi:hypothetical protein
MMIAMAAMAAPISAPIWYPYETRSQEKYGGDQKPYHQKQTQFFNVSHNNNCYKSPKTSMYENMCHAVEIGSRLRVLFVAKTGLIRLFHSIPRFGCAQYNVE